MIMIDIFCQICLLKRKYRHCVFNETRLFIYLFFYELKIEDFYCLNLTVNSIPPNAIE